RVGARTDTGKAVFDAEIPETYTARPCRNRAQHGLCRVERRTLQGVTRPGRVPKQGNMAYAMSGCSATESYTARPCHLENQHGLSRVCVTEGKNLGLRSYRVKGSKSYVRPNSGKGPIGRSDPSKRTVPTSSFQIWPALTKKAAISPTAKMGSKLLAGDDPHSPNPYNSRLSPPSADPCANSSFITANDHSIVNRRPICKHGSNASSPNHEQHFPAARTTDPSANSIMPKQAKPTRQQPLISAYSSHALLSTTVCKPQLQPDPNISPVRRDEPELTFWAAMDGFLSHDTGRKRVANQQDDGHDQRHQPDQRLDPPMASRPPSRTGHEQLPRVVCDPNRIPPTQGHFWDLNHLASSSHWISVIRSHQADVSYPFSNSII
ncbi:hypothetical protein ACLOJK_034189, partial [Asimina triloba]